jgi:hypothetical protein
MWRESRPVLTPFAHAFDFVFEFYWRGKSKAPPFAEPAKDGAPGTATSKAFEAGPSPLKRIRDDSEMLNPKDTGNWPT